jgi:hypothetical protein
MNTSTIKPAIDSAITTVASQTVEDKKAARLEARRIKAKAKRDLAKAVAGVATVEPAPLPLVGADVITYRPHVATTEHAQVTLSGLGLSASTALASELWSKTVVLVTIAHTGEVLDTFFTSCWYDGKSKANSLVRKHGKAHTSKTVVASVYTSLSALVESVEWHSKTDGVSRSQACELAYASHRLYSTTLNPFGTVQPGRDRIGKKPTTKQLEGFGY